MEPGSYGYGLNLVVEGRTDALANGSKRVERDFRLISVTATGVGPSNIFDTEFGIILGTEKFDWFSDYIVCSTILGNGALPHFVPGGGQIIEKGDFIVARIKNLTATRLQISLLFDGFHI